ncbi:hypothetical protein CLOSYM_03836 [[Clostridium] symbiosum ATCC 14940]|uniref:Uncharacterized protein n=1 Tax=[Clostridium] symbiosum ATCC 14940 TaxID=411472 RepID=A0ABC9TTJ7_CLOSY|nr:hypothetical protein CLOSYM_03836 [[Clostridium] symbiosum ATCC 14940]
MFIHSVTFRQKPTNVLTILFNKFIMIMKKSQLPHQPRYLPRRF